MITNAYNKKAAYSLRSIDEAKQVSQAFGGTTWYHEDGKTYSVNTVWHVMRATDNWWFCDRDSEADAIETAKGYKNTKVVRDTCIWLIADSGDPLDDELISVERVTIWSR